MFRTTEELDAGLDHVRASPADQGALELIVCRPEVDERKVVDVADLSLEQGLAGDNWLARGNRRTDDGRADPDAQLNLINARAIALICPDATRRPLAGDQLHLDLDLSEDNLPPGTRLAIGTAVIEITAKPHTGCAKFRERFGADAMRWVNNETGRRLHLRGVNAKVVQAGTIERGAPVRKVPSAAPSAPTDEHG